MSAEPAQSWRITLPCTRLEAEALRDDIGPLALLDNPPVFMTSEPDPDKPDAWQLDVYVDGEPAPALIDQVIALVPSAKDQKPVITPLPAEDWVTLSQAGLEPIDEGRFHIYTEMHAEHVPADRIAFRIEAGRAFGTGQHHTTAGCLAMLDRLASEGRHFDNALDLGTGTGVLGFAIARAFGARVIASDIDPVSIDVANENAAINAVPLGQDHGMVELAVADGLQHPRLQARAPYDLIVANILAGPLIEMAGDIAAALAPGGTLLLAGLLDHQAEAVAEAYRPHGCTVEGRIDRDDWPTLRLMKRAAP